MYKVRSKGTVSSCSNEDICTFESVFTFLCQQTETNHVCTACDIKWVDRVNGNFIK